MYKLMFCTFIAGNSVRSIRQVTLRSCGMASIKGYNITTFIVV